MQPPARVPGWDDKRFHFLGGPAFIAGRSGRPPGNSVRPEGDQRDSAGRLFLADWIARNRIRFLHMVCTILPLLFFSEEVFTHFPYGLTLEGQYIVKNLVRICAALML